MLQHVALEVAPAVGDACVAFWALLGFEEVAVPPGLRETSRWVQRESTQIHLMWVERPEVPARGHGAVVVADYASTLDALRAAGFAVDPRPEHWGAPRAFVRDPAGHRVELMAAPPA